MLLNFTVGNFRSIKEEQTLSLVASKGHELEDTNTFEVETASGQKLRLLRAAVIYGANASGKTNLHRALWVMQQIVGYGLGQGVSPNIQPFAFDQFSLAQPSLFEVVLLLNNVKYQYGFTATKERIFEEWLYAFPKGQRQTWFERRLNPSNGAYEYDLGDKLTGKKEVWKESTLHTSLFLAIGGYLNSTQLLPLVNWFRNALQVVGVWGYMNFNSAQWCRSEKKQKILNFLQAADLGITDVKVNKDIAQEGNWTESFINPQDTDIRFTHAGKNFPVEFALMDESDGTKKMFRLAAPWVQALEEGRVLFMDELHDNLHPVLVEYLICLFHDSEVNTKNAQLVFTTHETSILSKDIFRRDQVYFCEKNADQATEVIELEDFKPRKDESFAKNYRAGRYGALPILDRGKILQMLHSQAKA